MLKNLKQSEKILLSVLVVAVVVFLFLNILLPKYEKIAELNREVESLSSIVEQYVQMENMQGSDPVSAEEKELDNQLLTYKNDYYIDDFSQDYMILKLNDFAGADTSAVTGFSIEQIAFQKLPEPSADGTEATATDSTDTSYENDPYVNPDAETSTETETEDSGPETISDKYNSENPPPDVEAELGIEDPTTEEETSNAIKLSEINQDLINRDAIDMLYANVNFTGTYDSLLNFTNNIEQYSDSIIIKSVLLEPVVESSTVTTLNTDGEPVSTNGYTYIGSDGYVADVPDETFIQNGTVKGTMELIFLDFKVYDDDLEYSNPVFDDNSDMNTVENPFKPFDNFTTYEKPAPEQGSGSNNTGSGYNNNNSNVETGPTVSYKTIYNFESPEIFFSSSPESTTGYAQLSPLAFEGNNAGKLSYTFTKGMETSTASYVFDTNNILITEPPLSIALKVYELTTFPYDLGITLRDSSGETYNIVLTKTQTDDSSAWTTYEATLPEMAYPCVVKRVFVTTEGHEKTVLQGDLLFDQLQVSKQVTN